MSANPYHVHPHDADAFKEPRDPLARFQLRQHMRDAHGLDGDQLHELHAAAHDLADEPDRCDGCGALQPCDCLYWPAAYGCVLPEYVNR